MIPQTMYPQPTYGQSTYPQINTWAPPTTPMPTQITQQSPPAMFGKVITNPNEISPQDIPTDGNSCYFPMADKSCIYVKSWNPDCTMSTVRYVPETAVPASTQPSEQAMSEPATTTQEVNVTDVLIEHLERIEKAIKDSARKQVYGGKKNGNPVDTGSD